MRHLVFNFVEIRELIVTNFSKRGSGKDETSPVRTILEIYAKDGKLMAWNDTQGNFAVEDLIAFGKFCTSNSALPIEESFLKWKSSYHALLY